jgi:hypothetical protein
MQKAPKNVELSLPLLCSPFWRPSLPWSMCILPDMVYLYSRKIFMLSVCIFIFLSSSAVIQIVAHSTCHSASSFFTMSWRCFLINLWRTAWFFYTCLVSIVERPSLWSLSPADGCAAAPFFRGLVFHKSSSPAAHHWQPCLKGQMVSLTGGLCPVIHLASLTHHPFQL